MEITPHHAERAESPDNEVKSASQHDHNTLQPLTTLSFHTLPNHLPTELTIQILHSWTAPQRLLVTPPTTTPYKVSYTCSTDATVFETTTLPRSLQKEYSRFRKLSWLTKTKDFDAPFDFYMSHYFLDGELMEPSEAWEVLRDVECVVDSIITIQHPWREFWGKSGLEKVRLDFGADEYFALFDVCVPPFHFEDGERGDNLHRDPLLHSAAIFLEHTTSLTLHFGTAYKYSHPWSNLLDPAYTSARSRPHICESGLVIDWILSFAWHFEYLQHIPQITLTGDVQEWVKRKWHNIFSRQARYNEDVARGVATTNVFAVYKPDVGAISTIGRVYGEEEEEWMPEENYPPKCTCEVGCWRLVGGVVEDEIVGGPGTWDEVETFPDTPMGDWDELGLGGGDGVGW